MFILPNVIYRYAEYIYCTINFPDPPGEAHRILKKLEFYFMPKPGSWLNMAEIELSVLGRIAKIYIAKENTFRSIAQP